MFFNILGLNYIISIIINVNLNIYMLLIDYYSIKKFTKNFFLLNKPYLLLILKRIRLFSINLIKFILNNRILFRISNKYGRILAPSLNVYYPIKSAIFSVTIRITGGFLIIFINIYCIILIFNLFNEINFFIIYSLLLLTFISLQIHQFNSLII